MKKMKKMYTKVVRNYKYGDEMYAYAVLYRKKVLFFNIWYPLCEKQFFDFAGTFFKSEQNAIAQAIVTDKHIREEEEKSRILKRKKKTIFQNPGTNWAILNTKNSNQEISKFAKEILKGK